MFVKIYDEVATHYAHLEGYLLRDEIRRAVELMDKHFPDIEQHITNSVTYGQFDYRNEFTRELFSRLGRLENNDRDRIRSFCEIVAENYKDGVKEAFKKAFDHFDNISFRHADLVIRTKQQRNQFTTLKSRSFTPAC